jgi:hypothetical protein
MNEFVLAAAIWQKSMTNSLLRRYCTGKTLWDFEVRKANSCCTPSKMKRIPEQMKRPMVVPEFQRKISPPNEIAMIPDAKAPVCRIVPVQSIVARRVVSPVFGRGSREGR